MNKNPHLLFPPTVKVIRTTLDSLRKRITSTLTVSVYVSETRTPDDERASRFPRDVPFFAADYILEIPNVVMRPTLDVIQQHVNRAVAIIVSIAKGITQWKKEVES